MSDSDIAVVIPCYNERGAITETLQEIAALDLGGRLRDVIVVDDGSTDGSAEAIDSYLGRQELPSLRLVRHSRNRGYGAALKTGIRNTQAPIIVITDADGTYPNSRIPDLAETAVGADMVVGSRTGENVTYPLIRKIPKWFLKRYVCWLVGRDVPDMNSGLRVFRRDLALKYVRMLPDGFSFTTTITMCMMTNNYDVRFVPIDYAQRVGSSKIKPVRDTLRFLQLITRLGMYFAPLRLLLPVSAVLLAAFFGSLCYDMLVLHNIGDKTVLLLLFAMNTGMFALLADMIDRRC